MDEYTPANRKEFQMKFNSQKQTLLTAFLAAGPLSAFATTHPVHGPAGFVAQKVVCAQFENGTIRIAQSVTERDVREYVTRLENGAQTYSYLMNEYCDPDAPIRELVKMTFMCCTMKTRGTEDSREKTPMTAEIPSET